METSNLYTPQRTPMNKEELTALIDSRIEKALNPVEAKLNSILHLLSKFEGAGTVMKLIFLGIAPLIAFLVWVKDHVKL